MSVVKRETLFGFIIFITGCSCLSSGVNLYALINMDGVEGSIQFSQETENSSVSIEVNLRSFKSEPVNYTWAIMTNLISYSERDRCNKRGIGAKVYDFTSKHGHLTVESSFPEKSITFQEDAITLFGPNSIWEKSILLEGTTVVCGNILSVDSVRVAEAVFTSPIAGSVLFRQLHFNSDAVPVTRITTDLFHIGSATPTSSNNDWKILATDILDSKSEDRHAGFCNHLTTLYDPDNVEDGNCSSTNHAHCKRGELTKKHGQVPVGAKRSRYSRRVTIDTNLPLPDLEGPRFLYVAIYNPSTKNQVLSCAKITPILPKETRTQFGTEGVKGYIGFKQQSPLDPTQVTVNLTNLQNTGIFYHVHLYPIQPRRSADDKICSSADDHFNPFGISKANSPSAANGTYDQYEVGDLSGKYGVLSGNNFVAEYIDPYITLFGTYSIVGRSVVIHKQDSSRWICSNIEYPRPVVTAIATFYYPFAGRVIFRQDAKNSIDDTTVFVESLIYVDNTKNNSHNHQWYVHTYKPTKDSLDWQNRCFSTGPAFNSYKVNENDDGYKDCRIDNPFRCATGDITRKFGRVSIASSPDKVNITRRFYTDINLPLSGPLGIIGRSLVIQDDLAPDFRGPRMGCANIQIKYPSRAQTKEWHVSGTPSQITGQLVFEQDTEYDYTITNLKLRGLNGIASGYHIHEVPVPVELSYPCTNDAVYGHFNPFKVDKKMSPASGTGTSDQYEVGDLSGKYGTLEDADSIMIEDVDLNLPLQGPNSIIGRSTVLHKKEKDERWICGDVQPFVKENARRIQAVASFHHPKGFAYGYIRLGQLEYSDGSLSDTTIEISLRYPGKNNKNITNGHSWGVNVNLVGEDQAVKAPLARCMAGGYRWNPYRVTSDSNNYVNMCTSRSPLNCEMGDLSGRLGPITVGGQRMVFTDSNLPLAGNYSVMKKSIVISEKNGDNLRFSCANIEPDNDIVQKIQIKKIGKGSGHTFIEKVREVLSVPEWMMHLDSGETKDYETCMHFTIYFRGPDAGRLQQDLDSLLNSGYVSRRYATAPGDPPIPRVKFPYQLCTTALDYLNNGNQWSFTLYTLIPSLFLMLV
ncbi:hypothetical protein CHUAL_006711 [Chamberlinius hualienensis]